MMVITFLVLTGGTALFWYMIYKQYRPAKRGKKEKKQKQPQQEETKPKLNMEKYEHA